MSEAFVTRHGGAPAPVPASHSRPRVPGPRCVAAPRADEPWGNVGVVGQIGQGADSSTPPGARRLPWVCKGAGGLCWGWRSCPCLCSVPAPREAGDAFQLLCIAQLLLGEAQEKLHQDRQLCRVLALPGGRISSPALLPPPATHHPKISGSACRSPDHCAQAGNGGSA